MLFQAKTNNAFIGNHNRALKRDFTWVQALCVLFSDHQLYGGVRKAAEWEEDDDHIQITFDDEPVDVDTVKKFGGCPRPCLVYPSHAQIP